MTTERVLVNGSVMDRKFFEENVNEANLIAWERLGASGATDEHHHCLVCMKAIAPYPVEEAYRSGSRCLCAYCRKNYVK